jgi:hypothetical protein
MVGLLISYLEREVEAFTVDRVHLGTAHHGTCNVVVDEVSMF